MQASSGVKKWVIPTIGVALILCAGAFWIAVRSSPAGMTGVGPGAVLGAQSTRTPAPEVGESSTAIAVPAVESTGERSSVLEAIRQGFEPVAGPQRGAVVTGRLIVRAIDHKTGRPLGSFAVRLLSETRFADEPSDSSGDELVLRLTPATYAVVVTSPGYEPVELPPVCIRADETLRLAPVELSPGSGRIRVEALGASTFERLSIELRGLGRRPCSCVAEGSPPCDEGARCPECGFARDDTSLPIGPDGCVEFSGLAQGRFALRVVDVHGRTLGDEGGLDLRIGEAATVSFDVSRWRAVEVEVLDSDDFSLSSEWSRRLAELRKEELIVSFESSDVMLPIDVEIRKNAHVVATARLVPPTCVREIACGGRLIVPQLIRPTADRERLAGDALWPESVAPVFPPHEVSCEVDPSGIAVLSPLSTTQLELHLAVADFVADVLVPPGNDRTRVRAQLRPNASASSESSRPLAVTYRAYGR